MLSKNIDKDPKDAAEFEEFEPESDAVVKMRGLPFEAGPAEIVRFFEGLAVAEKGVLICKDSNRRPSGEGYCVFVDEEALKAKRRSENPEEYEDNRYRALGYGGGGPMRSLGFGGGGPMRSGGGPGFGRGFGRPSPYDRPSGEGFGRPRGGGMPQGPWDMGKGGGSMRGGGFGRNMGYGPYGYGND